MLHSIKKRVFRLQVPLRPSLTPGSEGQHLRHQLRQIRLALQHLLHVHRAGAAVWLRLLHNHRDFSERMHLAYPNNDRLAQVCARLRKQTAHIADQFAREQRPLSPTLAHIRAQIELYIRRIIDVETLYPALDDAHAEYYRYKQKVDALSTRDASSSALPLSPRRPPDQARNSRNFAKLDRAEELHQRLLADVLQRQRKLFAVHAPLFHAALVAFWLSHASCVDALVESVQHAKQFAEAELDNMEQLDVQRLIDGADGDLPVSPHAGLDHMAADTFAAFKEDSDNSFTLAPVEHRPASTQLRAPVVVTRLSRHDSAKHDQISPHRSAQEDRGSLTVKRSSSSSSSTTSSNASSARTAVQTEFSPAVDVHEVHHIISRGSMSAAESVSQIQSARGANHDKSPEALQPLDHNSISQEVLDTDKLLDTISPTAIQHISDVAQGTNTASKSSGLSNIAETEAGATRREDRNIHPTGM